MVPVKYWGRNGIENYKFAVNPESGLNLEYVRQFALGSFCKTYDVVIDKDGALDPRHPITSLAIYEALFGIHDNKSFNLRQLYKSQVGNQAAIYNRGLALDILRNKGNCMEGKDPAPMVAQYYPDLYTLSLLSPYITIVLNKDMVSTSIDNGVLEDKDKIGNLESLAEDNYLSLQVLQTAALKLNKKDEQAAPQGMQAQR